MVRLRAHEILRQIQHLLLRQHLAGKGQLQHRHGRGVVVEDQRRLGARRHLADGGLGDGRHLRRGGADIDVGLEEDLDDADAGHGLAFDMLDVVDGGGQNALDKA